VNGVVPVADEIAPMLLCAHRWEVQAALGLLPFPGIFLWWLMGAVRA
jgi:hypothetical protein